MPVLNNYIIMSASKEFSLPPIRRVTRSTALLTPPKSIQSGSRVPLLKLSKGSESPYEQASSLSRSKPTGSSLRSGVLSQSMELGATNKFNPLEFVMKQ